MNCMSWESPSGPPEGVTALEVPFKRSAELPFSEIFCISCRLLLQGNFSVIISLRAHTDQTKEDPPLNGQQVREYTHVEMHTSSNKYESVFLKDCFYLLLTVVCVFWVFSPQRVISQRCDSGSDSTFNLTRHACRIKSHFSFQVWRCEIKSIHLTVKSP